MKRPASAGYWLNTYGLLPAERFHGLNTIKYPWHKVMLLISLAAIFL